MDDESRSLAAEHVAAARLRLRSARRLVHPAPAIELLRQAKAHATRAATLTNVDAPAPFASEEPAGSPDLELDRSGVSELETMRDALDAEVAALVAGTETRTVTAIRWQRRGRLAGLALALVLLVVHFARAHVGPVNLALGRPVTATSLKMNPPSPSELVDGKTRGTFGIHTNDEPAPQITIDLEAEHSIQRVVVWNRGDGWFDDCLPLVVETSSDGITWAPLGRRTVHFDRWELDAAGREARFVRIARTEPGYITLNEVEVFGR